MGEAREQRTTRAEDDAVERVVLLRTLDLHPAQASVEELVREIGGDQSGFAERDAVERAVHDLIAAGLLHRDGDLVTPTRTALRFDELLEQ